ncbi:hypothetical protein [Actinophytocola xanthii]|uniref:Uncharacterized protein n=1 Tax=Actinophytocola xanthii TaxID=1912961 RepID=A0A1Q8CMP7_9PSEU|nr:hypothetical protein [Actinophytocola xanthii]OLF15633.1 hypothetical protein BU204_21210 [Actinophytocola xanthii]
MRFELPNAVSVMNNAVAAVGAEGDAWEVIGTQLDQPIDEVLPAYDKKLELGLDPSGGDKRLEICGLRWGPIGKDVARLNGLAAAIENIAGVIRSGKEQLAHDWKGEAYDAFRAAIEKVEKTLTDYSEAVRTTAAGLDTALTGIQTGYTAYRDDSLDTHLNFDGLTPPQDWRKVEDGDFEKFAAMCDVQGGHFIDCQKNNDEQKSHLSGRIITKQNFEDALNWVCQDNASLVIGQYQQLARWGHEERSAVSRKINGWYRATDQLKEHVDLLLKEALENLRIIAEVKPFANLSLPGAAAASPGPYPGSGPSTGSSGGPSAGSYPSYPSPASDTTSLPGAAPVSDTAPVPGAASDPASVSGSAPVPGTAPASDTAPVSGTGPASDPAAIPGTAPASDTAPVPGAPAPDPVPGTVQIKDADRTISVAPPDGTGHVRLTVEDGAGRTKSYDLDFTTASGQSSAAPTTEAEPKAERVPAGTSGRCVIEDGPVTITAELSLFDPDTVTVTVAEGSGKPTTYTLDFAAPASPESATGEPPSSTPTAEDHPAPDAPTEAPGVESAPADRSVSPGPAERVPAQAADGGPPAGMDSAGADRPAGERPGATDPASGDRQTGAERAIGGEPTPVTGRAGADGDGSERRPPHPSPVGSTAPSVAGTEAPEPAAAGSGHRWNQDPSGTLSGVLVPQQPGGEAALPSAGAGEPAGAAGAGIPPVASSAGGSTEGTGRAGTGWSVHGDLFDSADPVYSMHGVLGEDDLKSG